MRFHFHMQYNLKLKEDARLLRKIVRKWPPYVTEMCFFPELVHCTVSHIPLHYFVANLEGTPSRAVTLARQLPPTRKSITPLVSACEIPGRSSEEVRRRGGGGDGEQKEGATGPLLREPCRDFLSNRLLKPRALIPIICLVERAASLAPGNLSGGPSCLRRVGEKVVVKV